MFSGLVFVLSLFLLSFATEQRAAAYVDPGSGTMIWQLLAAGVLGVVFYFRRFTSWLRGKK